MKLGDKTQARAEPQNKKMAARNIAITIGEWRTDRIETAQRRWPFELIQNACDTAKSRGVANLRLEFHMDGEELVFRHSGGHFVIEEIGALVYGGSSKPYAAESEYLGRFGSGFLVTHVVSPKVELSGQAAEEDGRYDFILDIDRTSDTPKDLVESIDSTIKQLNDASLVSDGSQWTEFRFPLQDQIGKEAVQRGLLELESELPFVLAFNNEIAQVIVRGTTFRAREKNWDGHVRVVSVDDRRVFVTYSNSSEVEVAVDAGPEGLRTLDGRPRIYAALPLVETASYIHTPFVLNSEKFIPTEARDSLKNDGQDRNRELLQKGFRLYPQLMDVITDREEIGGLYHGLDFRPIHEKRQDENPLWRSINELLGTCARDVGSDISVVQTGERRLPLRSVKLPGRQIHGEELEDALFCRYVSLFRSVYDAVPSDEELCKWLRVRRRLSWMDEAHLPPVVEFDEFLENLREEVRRLASGEGTTVAQFGGELGLPNPEKFLRSICHLANDVTAAGIRLDAGEVEHLVPNQKGTLAPVRGENGKPLRLDVGIPAKLKVLSEKIGWDLRSELIHGDFSKFDIVESLCGGRLDEAAVMQRLMSPKFVRNRKAEQEMQADEKRREAWITLFWWCLDSAKPLVVSHFVDIGELQKNA